MNLMGLSEFCGFSKNRSTSKLLNKMFGIETYNLYQIQNYWFRIGKEERPIKVKLIQFSTKNTILRTV